MAPPAGLRKLNFRPYIGQYTSPKGVLNTVIPNSLLTEEKVHVYEDTDLKVDICLLLRAFVLQ